MTTCSCGFSLQPHQKFCPSCGAQVASAQPPTVYPQYQSAPAAGSPTTYTQYATPPAGSSPAPGMSRCSHCGGDVNGNSPFCMHCGTPLAAAAAPSAPSSAPTSCPTCGSAVQANAPFCSMCGAHLTGQAAAAPAIATCHSCGQATNGNTPFCMHCGASLLGAPVPGMAQPMQRPSACTQCGYPVQVSAAFCTHCGVHYGPPMQPWHAADDGHATAGDALSYMHGRSSGRNRLLHTLRRQPFWRANTGRCAGPARRVLPESDGQQRREDWPGRGRWPGGSSDRRRVDS